MINSMFYVRGNRRDFNNWADMGNPGWDYNSVEPYFKKMEDFRGVTTPRTGMREREREREISLKFLYKNKR